MTNVDNFRENFKGVRANRYLITAPMPTGVPTSTGAATGAAAGFNFELYAKAISMPGSQIGMIPVSYQGRIIKFSGERQFGEWSMQVYDGSDNSTNLRIQLENWINHMDHYLTHAVKYNIKSDWTIKYNDMTGQGHPGNSTGSGGTPRGFILKHCWPIDISPIDLSYEAVDSFAEFTLTVAYDYHYPV